MLANSLCVMYLYKANLQKIELILMYIQSYVARYILLGDRKGGVEDFCVLVVLIVITELPVILMEGTGTIVVDGTTSVLLVGTGQEVLTVLPSLHLHL